jgi:RNA polymerase sigma-70 factor (ECF subfamily)
VGDHTPKLLLFARQQTRSEADAQDLLQEAVLESLERCGHREPPPLPLVFATIRRRAIDWARREGRRENREQVALVDGVPWFDTAVEERELQQLLQNAMSQVQETFREVITLKVWGGLTFAEISEVLGIPPATAASRYRYGLQELRKVTKGVFV